MFAVENVNWFEGYWLWVAATQPVSPVKCALWSLNGIGTGTVIPASVVTSGALTAGQWNFIPVPAALPLGPTFDGNVTSMSGGYVAAIGLNGPFSDTNDGFFNTNAPSSGPIHTFLAGAADGPWQANSGSGVFSTAGSDPSVTLPGTSDSGNSLLVDVQVNDTVPAGYTGTYRLWPNYGPGNHSLTTDDGVAYTIATEFTVSEAFDVERVWYLSPAGVTTLATKASVWNVSTQQIVLTNASPSWSGSAGSGWLSTALTGALQPGTYRVSVYNANGASGGWSAKDDSSGYFDLGAAAAGILNGPLSAPNLANALAGVVYNGSQGGAGVTPHAQPPFGLPPGESFPKQWAAVVADTDGSNAVHTQSYFVDIEGSVAAPSLSTTGATALPGAHFQGSATVTTPAGGTVTITSAVTDSCHFWFTPKANVSTTGNGVTVPPIQYGYLFPVDGTDPMLSVELDPAYTWDIDIRFRNAPPVIFEGFNPGSGGDLLTLLSAQGWIPL
jgi:hypothetical protein